jgi:hypothetical protein
MLDEGERINAGLKISSIGNGRTETIGEKEKRPDTTPASYKTTLKFSVGVTTSNHKRVTHPGFMACHQSWGQGLKNEASDFLNDINYLAAMCLG